MSEQDGFGDSVYQPQDDGRLDDSGELDMDDALGEPDTDEMLDMGYSPPERARGMDRWGTTGSEERQGENLELRERQLEPDDWERPDGRDGLGDSEDTDGELIDDQVGHHRAGRLVAPDEGAHADTEKDVVARDVGIDGGAASAEEAAMHVVEDEDARW
ncbi:DUF5709 domain-containing protein [Thalassiella azotivora]